MASASRIPSETNTPVAEPDNSDGSSLNNGVERITRTSFRVFRDVAIQTLANLNEPPGYEQEYENGRPSGIRLTFIPEDSIVSSLGFDQNDVIISVNGQTTQTPQRMIDVYEALQSEATVEIEFLRRGRPRTFSYQII